MDDKKTSTPSAKPQPVKQMAPKPVKESCVAEGCSKKPVKAEFCDEHYLWFKAGLIRRDGSYAKDFEKKYQQFQRKKAA